MNLEQEAREFVEKRMIPMIVDEDTHFYAADQLADFARQQLEARDRQIADELGKIVGQPSAFTAEELIYELIDRLRGEGE